MTGLELLRAADTTADEIADIVSEHCPPVVPNGCDRLSCRTCWLAWLTTGEPPKEKGPSDERTAPGEEELHPNLAEMYAREHRKAYLSLHSNACGTESVDYPVVYRAYDNKNNVDTLALKIAKKVGELMGTAQAGRTATRKNSSGGEYYGVLRGARAVGTPYYMLIEHSFHTNTKATKWLSEDANLDKLAVAEADILAEFFGMESSTTTEKTAIMGKAQATAQQMALFCRSKNAEPKLTACSTEELAEMFLEEGKAEGVRGDVAFAQSLHETGYFKFGGIVQPSQNNYGGIGALNGNSAGQAASFPNPRTGVRAQIQHLKAYASTEALVNACVDPRFSLVARGVAPYVEWLGAADNPSGKGWAVPGAGYGGKVVSLLEQILAQEIPQAPQTPEEGDGVPQWQKEALDKLAGAGVINKPDYWRGRMSEVVTVGEVMAIVAGTIQE